MEFEPLKRAFHNLEISKEISESSYFLNLTYTGEMIVKLSTLSLVAFVEEDKDNHKYKLLCDIVKSDGLGDWFKILNEIFTGPTYQFLSKEAYFVKKELDLNYEINTWQYKSVSALYDCLNIIKNTNNTMPEKVKGKDWLNYIAQIRNKTKGHGAPLDDKLSKINPYLEEAIFSFSDNFSLFNLPWAFLKKNLSGKYKVSQFSRKTEKLEDLKRSKGYNYDNGVYIVNDTIRKVPLIITDSYLIDFYVPNGNFGKKNFECLSYLTDNRVLESSSQYKKPVSVPRSETEGHKTLENFGEKDDCLSNLPFHSDIYIRREELEKNLKKVVLNRRHPVITLVGRGGIGKTSLAIQVLQDVAKEGKFKFIVWFSARDIDLLKEGVKTVKPNVINKKDISEFYCELVDESLEEVEIKFEEALENGVLNEPSLFVFDNFETINDPQEVYEWIDSWIRIPNKILITSRIREFKADYPINVKGMGRKEYYELAERYSNELQIEDVLNDKDKLEDIYEQSEGHPYVIKVMLGELADPNPNRKKPERIIANREDILSALFERTFANLSPVAKRVFLTVSNWKTFIPEIGLKAILLRAENEPMQIDEAIEEIKRYSLIETYTIQVDQTTYINVPLSAQIFGKEKLKVDQSRAAVEVDTQFLRLFGVSRTDEPQKGLKPRIDKFFKNIASKINEGAKIEDFKEMLEYICKEYPISFFDLGSFYEELNYNSDAIESYKNYLRYISDKGYFENEKVGWEKLYSLYLKEGNRQGEVNSLVQLSQIDNIYFSVISNSANLLNKLFYQDKFVVDSEEKRIQIERVISVMEDRIFEEGTCNDYSKLSWLYLNLKKTDEAKYFAEKGLEMDESNIHCLNILNNYIKN
jgi:tetratricopeptide (TPR) repeat protein